VTIEVEPTESGILSNTAEVDSVTDDLYTLDNSKTVTTTVNNLADLAISKIDGPDPLYVGERLTYTVTVSNLGPSDAPTVTVTDTLPEGVNYISAASTVGPCVPPDGQDVVCDLGILPAGESGILSNTAEVDSGIDDPDSSDNSKTVTTTVNDLADLTISKIDGPDPLYVGERLTYTVTVSNLGPSNAAKVTMTDSLPESVNYISAGSTVGPCDPLVGQDLVCDLETIPVDETVTVTIEVEPTESGILSNTAEVDSVTDDLYTLDNSKTVTTTVNDLADLTITKIDGPDPIYVEERLTYTVTVSNQGPSEAVTVTITDTLPEGVNYISAASTVGPCVPPDGQDVVCDLGILPAGWSRPKVGY